MASLYSQSLDLQSQNAANKRVIPLLYHFTAPENAIRIRDEQLLRAFPARQPSQTAVWHDGIRGVWFLANSLFCPEKSVWPLCPADVNAEPGGAKKRGEKSVLGRETSVGYSILLENLLDNSQDYCCFLISSSKSKEEVYPVGRVDARSYTGASALGTQKGVGAEIRKNITNLSTQRFEERNYLIAKIGGKPARHMQHSSLKQLPCVRDPEKGSIRSDGVISLHYNMGARSWELHSVPLGPHIGLMVNIFFAVEPEDPIDATTGNRLCAPGIGLHKFTKLRHQAARVLVLDGKTDRIVPNMIRAVGGRLGPGWDGDLGGDFGDDDDFFGGGKADKNNNDKNLGKNGKSGKKGKKGDKFDDDDSQGGVNRRGTAHEPEPDNEDDQEETSPESCLPESPLSQRGGVFTPAGYRSGSDSNYNSERFRTPETTERVPYRSTPDTSERIPYI